MHGISHLDPLRSKYEKLLHNITYDSEGRVTGAMGLMNVWLLKSNGTKVEGQALSDPIPEDWENAFIDTLLGPERAGYPLGMPDGGRTYGLAQRRYCTRMP